MAELVVHKKWNKHLVEILDKERDIDAIFFMNVPLNHIRGIPSKLSKEYGIPVAYFDGDMPTILPKYATDRGFKFNYYKNADLSEYDLFFTNSKGVIPDLKEMNAREVLPLYYAIDPGLFKPTEMEKTIDVSFYGHGNEFREEWMDKLITKPSIQLSNINFCIGGGGFTIDLGKAKMMGRLSYSAFRDFCCSSKICLNITRWSHTSIYASSTARPFELAGFGSCIVSQPYLGIEEWFDPSKEIIVANSDTEAVEIYQSLLDDAELTHEYGIRARSRALKEHTFEKRAMTVVQAIKGVSS